MTEIGRTPIREAIQRLAREHLIMVMPPRGLLVPELDLKKQLKLLRTRREVERLVCRSVAKSATREERDVFAQLVEKFEEASKASDDVSFVRLDREFDELCLIAARNEFAEAAMRLMHGLARRFWYFHYKQAAGNPASPIVSPGPRRTTSIAPAANARAASRTASRSVPAGIDSTTLNTSRCELSSGMPQPPNCHTWARSRSAAAPAMIWPS